MARIRIRNSEFTDPDSDPGGQLITDPITNPQVPTDWRMLPVHADLKESCATGRHTRCPDANPVPQAAQHLLGHLSSVYSQFQAVQPGRHDGRCELSVDEAANSGRHSGRLNTGGVVQRSRRLQLCRINTSFTNFNTGRE
jgi:hypothetical protein